MNEIVLPNYNELARILNKTTLKLHPSQVHGLICGMLCGDDKNKAWEELVTGSKESGKAHDVLQSLYDRSHQQLKEFLFEFELLLPDDDEGLPSRAEALTLWCQGFLTGLKFVNVQIIEREPGEVTEAINDIIEIAKMNYEDVVASEEDEAAYMELVEYIRMAVILIYQDLHDGTNQKINSKNYLH